MISIFVDNTKQFIKLTEFSDGTFNINLAGLQEPKLSAFVTIKSEVDPQRVALIANMIGRHFSQFKIKPHLHIPYLPNARADRVFVEGDSEPLESFFALLSISKDYYSAITVEDFHNPSLLPWWIVNEELLFNVRGVYDYVVIPDKGAKERCNKIAKNIGCDTLQGFKRRDLSTGVIVEIGVDCSEEQVCGKNILIADDICDGGGTFIPYARQLKALGATKVDLFVTHGIFSKGLDIFEEHFDNIIVKNFVGVYVNTSDILSFNHRI